MSLGDFQFGAVEIAERVQTQFVSGFTLSGASVFGNTVSGTVRIVHGIEFSGLSSGNQVEVDRIPASGSNVVIAKAVGNPDPVQGVAPATIPPGGIFDPLKPIQVLQTQENLNLVITTGLSGASANATVWYWDR